MRNAECGIMEENNYFGNCFLHLIFCIVIFYTYTVTVKLTFGYRL